MAGGTPCVANVASVDSRSSRVVAASARIPRSAALITGELKGDGSQSPVSRISSAAMAVVACTVPALLQPFDLVYCGDLEENHVTAVIDSSVLERWTTPARTREGALLYIRPLR